MIDVPCTGCGQLVTIYPPEDGTGSATCGKCAKAPAAIVTPAEETPLPRPHYLLDAGTLEDMLAELATRRRCQDCTGQAAVCVEGDEEWEVVDVHDPTCPALLRLRTEGE